MFENRCDWENRGNSLSVELVDTRQIMWLPCTIRFNNEKEFRCMLQTTAIKEKIVMYKGVAR